jgi:hypothetical protein
VSPGDGGRHNDNPRFENRTEAASIRRVQPHNNELCALLLFTAQAVVSLASSRVPNFWNLCFFLCAFSLGGRPLYTGLLRIGGGVFYRLNDMLLLYSLIFAVLVSALVRFAGHQRYIAILVLGLALAAFHVAVTGVTNPSQLLRLLKAGRAARNTIKS